MVSYGQLRTSLSRASLCIVTILIAAAVLSWPLLLNGGPFLLSDTTSYIRGADAAFYKATGRSTDWTDQYQGRSLVPGVHEATDALPRRTERPITLAGRSIYYGAFLYLSDRVAGLRLAATLQALFAATCLYLTFIRFRRGQSNGVFLAFVGALAIVSPVAYFSSYLEPDIFTGTAVLAAAHLVTRLPKLPRQMVVFWFAVLCAGTLFHSSNILILALALIVMLVVQHRTKLVSATGLMLLAASIIVGIAGEATFGLAVKLSTGDAPVRPPFLMARLIASGPGRDYLEETCPQSGFALCRHLDSLSGYSDDFLWSDRSANGVFSVVSNDERRAIAKEENRFVLDTFVDHPLMVFECSLLSVRDQWLKWGLSEFNLNKKQVQQFHEKLPKRIFNQQISTLAFQGAMPVRLVELIAFPVSMISLWIIAVATFRREVFSNTVIFIATLFIGIAADVAVCGAISTPHDRYSMRIFWLLPFAALILSPIVSARRIVVAPSAS